MPIAQRLSSPDGLSGQEARLGRPSACGSHTRRTRGARASRNQLFFARQKDLESPHGRKTLHLHTLQDTPQSFHPVLPLNPQRLQGHDCTVASPKSSLPPHRCHRRFCGIPIDLPQTKSPHRFSQSEDQSDHPPTKSLRRHYAAAPFRRYRAVESDRPYQWMAEVVPRAEDAARFRYRTQVSVFPRVLSR